MSDLLSAIDALTLPIKSKVVQQNDAGITCTSPVELPPLLVQLDNAIRSSMGKGTSGASLAFEAAPLNTVALFEAMKITEQIEQWCRIVKVKATRQPATDLRAWYVARLAMADDPAGNTFHTKQLEKWARTIGSLLDPPREKDLPDACPTCGAKSWWKDGAEYYRPLVVRYRPTDPIGSATALCRSCEATWSARELAYEIEQEDARHAATSGVA